jgi:hypothetical protein
MRVSITDTTLDHHKDMVTLQLDSWWLCELSQRDRCN